VEKLVSGGTSTAASKTDSATERYFYATEVKFGVVSRDTLGIRINNEGTQGWNRPKARNFFHHFCKEVICKPALV
jgi:hypothetical protein